MFNIASKKSETIEKTALSEMKVAAYPVITAPFDGVPIAVKVRNLNFIQIKSCGEFGIFDFDDEKNGKEKFSLDTLVEITNAQEKLLIETLVCPTYDEICNYVYGADELLLSIKKRIKDLKDEIENTKALSKKSDLLEDLKKCELRAGYMLPADFTAHIVSWALGLERGEIKKISKKMLLEAAILAQNGNDNPIDHIGGEFTQFHIEEINKAAWLTLKEHNEEKKIVDRMKANGIKKVIGGPKKWFKK